MKADDEMTDWVEALRSNWPSQQDEERLRARLAPLGIAAGALLASSTTAASAATAGAGATNTGLGAGLLSRVAALPWGAKIGLATAVATSAAAGPVWLLRSPDAEDRAERRASSGGQVSSRRAGAVIAPRAGSSSAGDATLPAARVERAESLPPHRAQAAATESRAHLTASPRPQVARAVPPTAPSIASPRQQAMHGAAAAAGLPVASFDEAAPVTESTLREETALIDHAFAALRDGDAARAGRFISEHERRFPNGVLRRERERARARIGHGLGAQERP